MNVLLVTHRIRISGMLHSLSSAAANLDGKARPVASAGLGSGLTTKESESFNVASSSINWDETRSFVVTFGKSYV